MKIVFIFTIIRFLKNLRDKYDKQFIVLIFLTLPFSVLLLLFFHLNLFLYYDLSIIDLFR